MSTDDHETTVAIIGGSGFYDFLEDAKDKTIDTPFGGANVEIGYIGSSRVIFIPRHGKKHGIPPHLINYRANIFAAHMEKAHTIYATNAMGSCDEDKPPGLFIVPDQLIDFTSGRDATFFDNPEFSVTTQKGRKLSGVVHTDVGEPFDNIPRRAIMKILEQEGYEYYDGGTAVTWNGPRYETPAEIKACRVLGGSYVGMTSSPEAFLAREIDIPYATLGVVTNYAAGMQSSVSHSEVEELFGQKIGEIRKIFRLLIS